MTLPQRTPHKEGCLCRDATLDDLVAVTELHMAAFPEFFLSSLGPAFVHTMYRAFLRNSSGIFVVAEIEGRVSGFAVGALQSTGKDRHLALRMLPQFVWALAPAVARHPMRVLRRVLSQFFSDGGVPAMPDAGAALRSIGVSPAMQGGGVAGHLLAAFEQRAQARGASAVTLTTDVLDNERAIQFYKKHGYAVAQEFLQDKRRRMFVMLKDLKMSAPSFLPFALPDIGEEEIAEVVQALRSGWVTTGPKAKQFETDFAQYVGGDVEAVAVNSATAGLHLGLEALGVGPGDEVITTTHTFTATAEIIRYLGADPVFVDVNADTLCIDVDAVEAAITPRTKAIIPVHFAGRSADMPALLKVAQKHGLRVMEDAAHALPTTCGGRMVGALDSDVTVFSFYANKTMTTGEGGMLVTRDPAIAKRARVMRLHGINRDAFDRFTSKAPSWYYEIVAPGFKYNMTDIAASMGIHQLRKASLFQTQRAHIAALYDQALAQLPLILPPHAAPGDIHSWHLYVIRLDDTVQVGRDQFVERMFEQGIGCSVHYIPLHLHPYWRDTYQLTPEMFPVSQRIYERTLSLPIYTRMTETDVARVVEAVKKALA